MHLDLRFGHKFDRCNVTDSAIVVESKGLQIGVIVHQVETVSDIDAQYIQPDLSYGRSKEIDSAFIQGVINLDDELILLLDADKLVRHPHVLEALIEEEAAPLPSNNFYEQYFPVADDRTKKILQRRAASLKQTNKDLATKELTSLAIVGINGNYFGLDLGVVREFTKIGRITTIPCCPSHVMGNMNLRGEILTLIDIRQPLNLGIKNNLPLAKAVVVEVGEIIVGIAVEEVFDVIDFSPEEIKPIPVAVNTTTAAYFQGMASYLGQPLNAIDLPKLLTQGAIKVKLAA